MSPKQKEIQHILLKARGKVMSLAEIDEKVSFGYYRNGRKHLGVIVSNMVKQGMIKRVSKGQYCIPSVIELTFFN